MNYPFKTSNTLFVGCGGGYDSYGAIPLLGMADGNVCFASYSSKKDFLFRESCEKDTVDWILKSYGFNCYTLGKLGVQGLKDGLNHIVEKENIQCIVAVDGGVDALMRGDEENSGTLLEDSIVLGAINECDVDEKYLACVGMGTESEEQLNHYRILENIAELASTEDFLGSCSLLKQSKEFRKYKEICQFAWKNNRKSHIQSRVEIAVEGKFGNIETGSNAQCYGVSEEVPAFINPLMGIYWFFNLTAVAQLNKIIPQINTSRTFIDALMLYRQNLKKYTRSKEIISL